jgi:hypothetical protein
MPNPVIFVPGYPGSHIHDTVSDARIYLRLLALANPLSRKKILEKLQGPDDLSVDTLRAADPIASTNLLFFDLGKQADSLYEILRREGIEPVKFGWDWRRPIYDTPMQQRLKAAVVDLSDQASDQVTLIVHSTGGLVARYLLESQVADPSFFDRIERVIAFGVPWAGTLKSFQYLAGRKSFGPIGRYAAQTLVSTTWAAFDLLPPDPKLISATEGLPRLVVDGAGRHCGPVASTKRGWFRANLAARMHPRADASVAEIGARTAELDLGGHTLPITNVVGWGARTAVKAVITGSGNQQRVRFVFEKGGLTTEGGDGTIPRLSADWISGAEVSTFHVPVGVDPGGKRNPHLTLWRNPGGKNLLNHLLGGKPLEDFVYGAVDEVDFVSGNLVRVRVAALDVDGRPLDQARVRAVELDGPDTPWSDFKPSQQGRHMIQLTRGVLPEVGSDNRRFRLEFGWSDGGVDRNLKRAFFIRR